MLKRRPPKFLVPTIPRKPIAPGGASNLLAVISQPVNLGRVTANPVALKGVASATKPAAPAPAYWYENGTIWALAPQNASWFPAPSGMYPVAFTSLQSFQKIFAAYSLDNPNYTSAWVGIPGTCYKSPAFSTADLPGIYFNSTDEDLVYMIFCCRPSVVQFAQAAMTSIEMGPYLMNNVGSITSDNYPVSPVAPGLCGPCTVLTTNGPQTITPLYVLVGTTAAYPIFPYVYAAGPNA